jgi:hypothetical protein
MPPLRGMEVRTRNRAAVAPVKSSIQRSIVVIIASPALVAATIKGATLSVSTSSGMTLGRVIGLDIECLFLPENTRQIALNLSARRFRQSAGTNQNNLPDCNLVLVYHGFADRTENVVDVQAMALGALDFMHDHQHFVAVRVRGGKSRPTVAAKRRMAVLRRILDVLRIMIHAANDDQILDSPGDEQLAVFIEKTEIAGTQPDACAAFDNGLKCVTRRGGIFPIALRDIWAAHAYFANIICAELSLGLRVDDRQLFAGHGLTAADHGIPVGVARRLRYLLVLKRRARKSSRYWAPRRSST